MLLSAPPAAPVIEPAPEASTPPSETETLADNPGEFQPVPLSSRAREWLRILNQTLDAQQLQESQSSEQE